ncbi:DinB family protein [Parachitinimonas caeni]|uniref:DinB family protein n=1 Tax=Parachitinimonas caeni TaxID=3031301 RepID=A0ABT7DRB0_9NEIS|nr:DinB family protein [Parachitinimonas caeni]MDK2122616.1 DinB family protein [Parachitinimonas caeni]
MISWKSHYIYQIDYQHWATDALFASLDKLSDDARKRDEGLPSKSIHASCNHMLAFNLLWWGRLKGESPSLRLDAELHAEWRELKAAIRQTLRQTQHWMETQNEEFFVSEIKYLTSTGKEHKGWVHDVLTNLSTHFAHQRGMIAGVITRLGAAPPNMDFIDYRRDMQDSLAHLRSNSNLS